MPPGRRIDVPAAGTAGAAARAFTVPELLVVIAIVGILLALLMGGLANGRQCARDTQCKVNLNHLYQAMHFGKAARLPEPTYWVGFVSFYGGADSLLCPSGDSTACLDAVAPRKPQNPDDPEDTGPPPDESDLEQNVSYADPPPSVVFNDVESSGHIRVFCEHKDLALQSPVQVNIKEPGYVDSFGAMSGGTVGAGTRVACYFAHFDPSGSESAMATGSLSFTSEIVGVICRDAELNASDPVLGHPGTRYPTGQGSRGFESGAEIVSLSQDRRTLTIHRFSSSFPGEQMRVLVERKQGQAGPLLGCEEGLGEEEIEQYGAGGPTSYGMNNVATSSGVWPGQVLLVEYHRALVDVDRRGVDDNFGKMIAARHFGLANVLFGDGSVRGMTVEDLDPLKCRMQWWPANGVPEDKPSPP